MADSKDKNKISKKCYDNRELSWLKFNQRVLEEAEDTTIPLCDRASFIDIFMSNLDEFYMVRVGSLFEQALVTPEKKDSKTNLTAKEQLDLIFDRTRELQKRRDKAYVNLMEDFEKEGLKLVRFKDIEHEEAKRLERYFYASILPLLSPQIIGKKHPFPFLVGKEIYAVALLSSGPKTSDKLCIVPCRSNMFNRLIPVRQGEHTFILVEELILHFLPNIFDQYTVKSKSLIKIVRSAEIDIDEDFQDDASEDYRETMEELIRVRKRLEPVKMDCSRPLDEKVIVELCSELGLEKKQIFRSSAPLDTSIVFEFQDMLRGKRELFFPRRVPQISNQIDPKESMIAQIEKKDILLSYPFENISSFIRLLNEAAQDERVDSIKMTLYRVAKNSQVVEALIDAAENGKEVVVLVELRARFDEENNIEWSRRMEDAGCRIVYGIDNTKVHSKICLITYRSEDSIKHICQIGTGNYNEKTSKLYTDLSLMTADENIAHEVNETFSKICLAEFMENTKYLLVSPLSLQNKVLEMIDEQIARKKEGLGAYIGLKMNSLTDKKIINRLIEASMAGVKVDMVIRGICCLVPGIEGYTDNIFVESIVGRYLEHSRIYIFGEEGKDKIYISSADFMTRNTTKRVEVAAPVYDKEIKQRIRNIFNTLLEDNVKARVMGSDGIYRKKEDDKEKLLNAQEYFFDVAYNNVAKAAPIETAIASVEDKSVKAEKKKVTVSESNKKKGLFSRLFKRKNRG